MRHTVLTFVTRVDPGKVRELEALLAEIAHDVAGNRHVPFSALARLHFASLVIFPDPRYGPYLVFEHNFDGSLRSYLDDLLEAAGDGLHRIYSHCLEYRATGPSDRATMRTYLRAHVVRPSAYHVGNVGRSADRVRRERKLRDDLEAFLDRAAESGTLGSSAGEIRGRIQEYVGRDPKWGWACQVQPRQTTLERLAPRARIAAVLLGAIPVLPVLLPAALVWFALLRRNEERDPVWTGPDDPVAFAEHIQRLQDQEDRSGVIQNHLANLSPVKPGRLRRVTLRLVLAAANLVARLSTNGTLSGIPSIHYAHWSQIDGGRRLLFLSNYDGSWENYLDDFIDKASSGLTAIWGNTVRFPRTRRLVGEGSRDGANFKAIARARQVPTNVWYSAYPDLTVQQIDKNSTIREQLFAPLDEAAERAWLRNF